MTQLISLKQVRAQLSEIIGQETFGRDQIVITRFGKPSAVLLNYLDFERLMNPRSRFATQKDWEEGFKILTKIRERTKAVSSQKIEKIVREAVLEVRKGRGA